LDISNQTIYELKPNNPRAIRRGEKQVEAYMQELEKMPRFQWIKWKIKIDTY
jgi:hypothetical protein